MNEKGKGKESGANEMHECEWQEGLIVLMRARAFNNNMNRFISIPIFKQEPFFNLQEFHSTPSSIHSFPFSVTQIQAMSGRAKNTTKAKKIINTATIGGRLRYRSQRKRMGKMDDIPTIVIAIPVKRSTSAPFNLIPMDAPTIVVAIPAKNNDTTRYPYPRDWVYNNGNSCGVGWFDEMASERLLRLANMRSQGGKMASLIDMELTEEEEKAEEERKDKYRL